MCSKRTDATAHADTPLPLRIAITGGIGSGKSHVCRMLEAAGRPVYYCDDEAKRIMRTSAEVRRELTALIGPDAYTADLRPAKAVIAAYLCASPDNAARLNAVVHPRVAADFRAWAARQAAPQVYMECALLFESGFDALVDVSALVTVSPALRLRRVMERDHITAEKAREWMSLQMPEEEKARRADLLLHNDDERQLAADIEAMLQLNHPLKKI